MARSDRAAARCAISASPTFAPGGSPRSASCCDAPASTGPIVSQPYYNAMNRMPEVEHLPACGYYGLGVVPYSPLARGVLTGKYDPDAAAARGHPRRAPGQAHDADRVAPRIAACIAQADQAARRGQRASPPASSRWPGCSTTAWSPRRSPVRAPRSSGRTICGASITASRRGRGPGRQPGDDRPSLDAGLQRSRPTRSRAACR